MAINPSSEVSYWATKCMALSLENSELRTALKKILQGRYTRERVRIIIERALAETPGGET